LSDLILNIAKLTVVAPGLIVLATESDLEFDEELILLLLPEKTTLLATTAARKPSHPTLSGFVPLL
jgi:hypothetical protein